MKNTHQKIINTKKALLDALIKLMKTQQTQDITVSHLCREASVNRTTFYKYYSVPSDIVHEYILGLTSQMLIQRQSNQSTRASQEIYDTLLITCELCYENQLIMQLYMSSDRDMFQLLKNVMDTSYAQVALGDSRIYFIAGGCTSVLVQWMIQGYKHTPTQMAELLTRYILQMEGIEKEKERQ